MTPETLQRCISTQRPSEPTIAEALARGIEEGRIEELRFEELRAEEKVHAARHHNNGKPHREERRRKVVAIPHAAQRQGHIEGGTHLHKDAQERHGANGLVLQSRQHAFDPRALESGQRIAADHSSHRKAYGDRNKAASKAHHHAEPIAVDEDGTAHKDDAGHLNEEARAEHAHEEQEAPSAGSKHGFAQIVGVELVGKARAQTNPPGQREE